jgi:hypothetical protein
MINDALTLPRTPVEVMRRLTSIIGLAALLRKWLAVF